VLRLTCQVIAIKSLLSNVIQTDISFSLTPKWQRFSTVIQCLIKSSQLFSDSVCHQIISTFQWCRLYSDSVCHQTISTLQWFSVSSHHTDFLVIQPFQCLSVSSNHLHYAAIKYAFPSCCSWTTRYGMSLYKDMSSRNASSDYTRTPPFYLHTAHALPFSKCSSTTAYHLFGADDIWKEMLGLSWHWSKWLRRLLYIDFINCWLQLQY
jgi:hypothetical protein